MQDAHFLDPARLLQSVRGVIGCLPLTAHRIVWVPRKWAREEDHRQEKERRRKKMMRCVGEIAAAVVVVCNCLFGQQHKVPGKDRSFGIHRGDKLVDAAPPAG